MKAAWTTAPIAAAIALAAAGGARAEGWVVKAGATLYQPHSRTDGVRGIGIPDGADVTVRDATTALFIVAWEFNDHVSLEGVLGIPPRVKTSGAGTVAFLGDDVLSAKNLAPSLILNYTFGAPGDLLRPYVGAGINYTRFIGIRSRLSNDVHMSRSVGPLAQVGLNVEFTRQYGLYASVARVDVQTDVVAVASTVLQTHVDFRPVTYSLGAWYRF